MTHPLDIQAVKRSFNKAASTYEQTARIQSRIAKQLINLVAQMPNLSCISKMVDLGSGTGNISKLICEHIPHAKVIELDIAFNMLQQTKTSQTNYLSDLICADAHYLPFHSASIDFFISNLFLQWSHNPNLLIKEIHGSLIQHGWFLFSTLGPKTLFELKESWKMLDNDIHVNDFISDEQITAYLTNNGFKIVNLTKKYLVENHVSLQNLMHTLKKTGTNNINTYRPKSLSGKNKFRRLAENYQALYSINNQLPVTYEAIYVLCQKI